MVNQSPNLLYPKSRYDFVVLALLIGVVAVVLWLGSARSEYRTRDDFDFIEVSHNENFLQRGTLQVRVQFQTNTTGVLKFCKREYGEIVWTEFGDSSFGPEQTQYTVERDTSGLPPVQHQYKVEMTTSDGRDSVVYAGVAEVPGPNGAPSQ